MQNKTPEEIADEILAQYGKGGGAENVLPFSGKRKRKTGEKTKAASGYQMIDSGLYLTVDSKREKIAGQFEVLGRARDPSGDDWARWVSFRDDDKREHKIAIKDSELHGDPAALAATLARQGLWISLETSYAPAHWRDAPGLASPCRARKISAFTQSGSRHSNHQPKHKLKGDYNG